MRAQQTRTQFKLRAALTAWATLGVTFGLCASAGADIPSFQCPPGVANCTTAFSPWVDVPKVNNIFPSLAKDQAFCPPGTGTPVGFTYEGGDEHFTRVAVSIYQNYPNWNNPWNPGATNRIFFVIVNYGRATAVRVRIGCVPNAANAVPAALDTVPFTEHEQVWAVALQPSRVRSYTRRCARRTGLVESDATVEFLGNAEPSMPELTAVSWNSVKSLNGVTVKVRTTSKLRRHARLRIFLFCQA